MNYTYKDNYTIDYLWLYMFDCINFKFIVSKYGIFYTHVERSFCNYQ